jgi:hypothetical protein
MYLVEWLRAEWVGIVIIAAVPTITGICWHMEEWLP